MPTSEETLVTETVIFGVDDVLEFISPAFNKTFAITMYNDKYMDPNIPDPSLINYGSLSAYDGLSGSFLGQTRVISVASGTFWKNTVIENHGIMRATSVNSDARVISSTAYLPNIVNTGEMHVEALKNEAIGVFGYPINALGLPFSLNNSGLISSVGLKAWGVMILTSTLENSGVIQAKGGGQGAFGLVTAYSIIHNSGDILAEDTPQGGSYGIAFSDMGANAQRDSTLYNTGLIQAKTAITELSNAPATVRIENLGDIRGAIELRSGQDVILNGGRIFGDTVLGGDADVYDGRGGSTTGFVDGGQGDDLIIGGDGVDDLRGGDGSDILSAGLGDNQVRGGAGSDLIVLGGGRDVLLDFEFGVDRFAGATFTGMSESGGDTHLSYVGGSIIVRGITGRTLGDWNGAVTDYAMGSVEADRLLGGAQDEFLDGGAGDDFLDGGPGDDRLRGGQGVDTVSYARGPAVIVDLLLQGQAQDTGQGLDILTDIEWLEGSGFDDALFGNGLQNFLWGLDGADLIDGDDGSDLVDGGRGDDLLFGGYDNDTLLGGDGDDVLIGGWGADVIEAGAGDDLVVIEDFTDNYDEVTLGAGRDIVYIAPYAGDWVLRDTTIVTDFTPGEDVLNIQDWLAAGLINLKPGLDPFASGHLRLLQAGPDVKLQLDRDGGGDNFVGYYMTMVTFQNVSVSDFTLADLGFDQGFALPTLAYAGFGVSPSAGGWTSQDAYPRSFADMNGDGLTDVAGFGAAGLYVALGNGVGGFGAQTLVLNSYGYDASAGGWVSQDRFPRTFGDVNGDGHADVIGFGDERVQVALANGSGGFLAPITGLAEFGQGIPGAGWGTQLTTPRMSADVNGDGLDDLVGFRGDGVVVALATGDGLFADAQLVSRSFGADAAAGGWVDANRFPRLMADVNGDGLADIIGFGDDGVLVSLATGGGSFGSAFRAISEFGSSVTGGGWTSNGVYPRTAADVNGDGRADLIGFGDERVYVALANADGTFSPSAGDVRFFARAEGSGGFASADENPRGVGDINGDGYADLIGVGDEGLYVSLGGPGAFEGGSGGALWNAEDDAFVTTRPLDATRLVEGSEAAPMDVPTARAHAFAPEVVAWEPGLLRFDHDPAWLQQITHDWMV